MKRRPCDKKVVKKRNEEESGIKKKGMNNELITSLA